MAKKKLSLKSLLWIFTFIHNIQTEYSETPIVLLTFNLLLF